MGQSIATCLHQLIGTVDRIAGTSSMVLLSVFAVVLSIGVIRAFVYAIHAFRSTRKLENTLRWKSEPVEISELTGNPNDTGEVYIYQDTGNFAAFSIGLTSPKVYLSSAIIEEFDQDALDIIIQHELGHKNRFDPLRRFLLRVTAEIFWFLPIIRPWLDRLLVSSEADCDTRALRRGHSATEVANTLISVADFPSGSAIPPHVAWNSIGDKLELRVRVLLGENLNRLARIPLKVSIISLIMLLLVSTAGLI